MSEESSSKDEHPEIFKNAGMTQLPILKIDKLKREDDDEQWISGEELNTDGSSDEKGKTSSTKKKRSKVHVKAKITAKGAIAKDVKVKTPIHRKKLSVSSPDGNSGAVVNDDQVQIKGGTKTISDEGTSKCLEIIDTDLETISWRPKRGSIKLPTMGKEDTETEEETISAVKAIDEVFLITINKVHDLQASFPKVHVKEKSGMQHVNDTNSARTELGSKDKADKLSSSEGLLHAFEQIKRLDCLVAKNQEARRVEDALRDNIKSEEVFLQLCSAKSKRLKNSSDVKEAVDGGLLLPKGQIEKDIPIPTATEEFSVPLAKKSQNDNFQSTGNLEIISSSSSKTENNITHNDQGIKPSQHFIKRNIKLATEGHRMGSLTTITDEERIQLDRLLEDLDQQEQTLVNGESKGNQVFGDSAYSLCFDTMGSISEIDTKLEKINEERYSKGDRQNFNKARKLVGFQDSEVDEKRLWKGADAAMNMKRRLNEINKSLYNLNEPSKEVQPIEEDQIQQLVDEFCGKLTEDKKTDSILDEPEGRATDSLEFESIKATRQENEEDQDKGRKPVSAERVLSSAQVKEIVELTKSQMPCFKFKHQ